ncbi:MULTISPECIES: carbohydrate ABC transporter permease [Paenibacillus]|jgi:putative aldouronate transport system permease protein|uniref:ABC transporter permease subunit n=2 Tax=Paenibacillus TaxID=44249 RepID=A0ABX1X5C7_9BACL|nr:MULTISPECIES: carbohydrate ABC transporter permease [Paenibacillus]KRE65171.1 sugar ABC transporter permease [Paenibacillus sp. Soil750]NOU63519.1 ABC transporter permease subunit [Paenibacillus plantarum]NQX63723.1 carbohydrate ABC transporter permease [Paenibacillus qinlingensis]CAH1209995.1 L-arabinose transport system permease protein AraQ [Paenibacillus allorhizoplanae]
MSEAISVRKQRIARKRGPNELTPTANLLVNVFFWIYTAACIMPLVLVIIVSFSDEKGVLIHGYNFIPEAWSLEAYKFMFKDWHQILRSFGISVFLATVGTAISLVMMSLYAYPISRSDFPHRSFFSFFMFFTMLFNGGLVPWYLVYTQMLDLKNTIAALMLPLLVSAFFVLLLRTFFANSIPMPLIEAAKIDGAGEVRIFSQIIIPLSLPVLASVGLFQVLNYWNDWFLSLVFISGSKNINLQFMMYKTMLDIQFLTSNVQASQGLSQAGGMLQLPTETVRMAMAVLGIGPIVFAYPFFQKYFKKGLTVGAIKG